MVPTNDSVAKSKSALGFLTVLEHPEHGLFGGYLTLNLAGRPLEFHCTTPIKPNRAQQILYGPTLESYVFGEQIGQTLLDKSTIDTLVVCTDRRAALAIGDFVSVPVVLVFPPDGSSDGRSESVPGQEIVLREGGKTQWRVDGPHAPDARLREFRLGCNRLAVPDRRADDRQSIVQRLVDLPESFDLAEPFDRIRGAIEEAQRGGQ